MTSDEQRNLAVKLEEICIRHARHWEIKRIEDGLDEMRRTLAEGNAAGLDSRLAELGQSLGRIRTIAFPLRTEHS
jgi:hypothetical protein